MRRSGGSRPLAEAAVALATEMLHGREAFILPRPVHRPTK
jgi:hypothetical protein